MADSPLLQRKPGDAFLLPNLDLTRETLERFFARHETGGSGECLPRLVQETAQRHPQSAINGRKLRCQDGHDAE
jgi:hypothetical protein